VWPVIITYGPATCIRSPPHSSDAVNRSLDYLLDKQQIKTATTDLDVGAFPRFSALDGVTDRGCCEQLDEDAFPIILAWQLGRFDATVWGKLKLTAEHIVKKGPATPSERWEEQDGLSPSTIAAEIASLVCAADIRRPRQCPKILSQGR
jgi:glucoamylase